MNTRSHIDLLDSGKIPTNYHKGPDLSYYTETAEFYYGLICDSAPYLKDKPPGVEATAADKQMAGVAYGRIVNGSWGLIAKGPEAIPHAMKLLRSADRDLREAGANVFCGIRSGDQNEEIISEIAEMLKTETDRLVIDSLIGALGELRSRSAIALLSRYIRNEHEDSDTRWEAACSLGKIVRRRFDRRGEDAVASAVKWLDQHEKEA
jgi:hypothetical protein